ncbi:MAG TPA: GntR family transcriptional regulator [Solirubrobacteraceae bacterium]|nr:GntR family transcriptional regulator [Solirubrobacteraceae bacterium]
MSDVTSRTGDNVVQVHDKLRAAILAGDVRPGAKTSQAELARDLDVGRTPLREAIRMLQSEGLIFTEPNRRVVIASLSIEDAEELYVLRITVEVAAARITLPQLTEGDFAELEGYMAQMSHLAGGVPGPPSLQLFRGPHREFHQRFVSGAGQRISQLIGELFDHAERYRRVYGSISQVDYDKRAVEHRQMLDAAIARDADGLAAALAAHYLATALLVTSVLDPSYRLDRLRTTVEAVAPGAMYAFG